MKCDRCGKEMLCEEEVALLLQMPDRYPLAQRSLGKYYGKHTNVDMLITWAFCFECVLDKLLVKKPSFCIGYEGP